MTLASEEMRRFNEEVGRRIAAARRELGVSGVELARAAEIAPSALCAFESGERRCAAYILARLAAALRVGVADLIPKFAICEIPKKSGREAVE